MEPLSIGISLSVLLHFTLAMVIFLGSKTRSAKTISLMAFLTGVWIAYRGVYHAMPQGNEWIVTLMNDLSFSTGIVISSLFVYFVLVFPEEKKPPKKVIALLVLANIILIPVYYYKDLFLGHVEWIGGISKWKWQQGPYLLYYDFVWYTEWLVGFGILYWKSLKYEGEMHKQLRRMFWVMIVAVMPVEITSLYLPRFHDYFVLEWTSSLTMMIWTFFLGYVIVKHNQMNIRTVTTELMVIAAIGLLFLNIFI